MRPTVHFLKQHRLEVIIFFIILLLASFLRLFRIRQFVIFLGDEGRDALVVKRMIVDHDLTLLGPTASVGGFYHGPAYYYMMIPAMILSDLDPVGPAIMIALMGITTVALLYLVTRDWFGKFPALIVSLLYTVSPGIVNFSRSSWNPNPLPLFSLIAIASIHYGSVKNKPWLIFLSGVCFGIAIQLHYFGIILGPILLFILLIQSGWQQPSFFQYLKTKVFHHRQSSFKNLITAWKKHHTFKLILTLGLGFLLGASMYLAFELRHSFPNTKSIIEFVNRPGKTTGLRSWNFPWLFYEINRFTWESIISSNLAPVAPAFTYLLLALVIFYLYRLIETEKIPSRAAITTILFWTLGVFGISLYKGQLHYHYFQYLFPAPFLILAMVLSTFKNKRTQRFIASFFLLPISFLLYNQHIWTRGSNLIDQTAAVADQVVALAGDQEFNFALITPGNSDHAYRFFLELKGHKPVPIEDKVTEQLIIVCEMEAVDCKPLGHPLWEIAAFGRAEVRQVYSYQENVNLFRLTHHPDSLDLIGHPAPRG